MVSSSRLPCQLVRGSFLVVDGSNFRKSLVLNLKTVLLKLESRLVVLGFECRHGRAFDYAPQVDYIFSDV